MVKAIAVPGGGKLSRKETDALAEWAKGFGAKGLAVTKVTAGGFDTGVAKFLAADRRQAHRAHRRQRGRSALLRRRQAQNRPQGSRRIAPEDGPRSEARAVNRIRLGLGRRFPRSSNIDEEEKRFVSTHHPFTAPLDDDLSKLDSRDRAAVESIKSKAYDIVVNGSEVGGGSIRIHRMDVQQKVFSLLGIDEAAQKAKFGFLLDALQYGAPPHGGIALGLDRLIMILRGITQHPRRDRLPQDAERRRSDVRRAAPIDEKQLREANIRVVAPPRAPAPPEGHNVVHKDSGRVN